MKRIPNDRKCSKCGTNQTYINKNGFAVWGHDDNNNILCKKCWSKHYHSKQPKSNDTHVRNENGQFVKNANLAENNTNWQGGKGKVYARMLAKRLGLLETGCLICSEKNESLLQVHHIDHNEDNNIPSNLEVYCTKHHQSVIHLKDKCGHAKTGKNLICPICKKEFYVPGYRLKEQLNFYCSRQCSGVSKSITYKETSQCVSL